MKRIIDGKAVYECDECGRGFKPDERMVDAVRLIPAPPVMGDESPRMIEGPDQVDLHERCMQSNGTKYRRV